MDLGIFIQAAGDDAISIRRKHVMENLVSPNTTGRRGLVETFIVIRHDFSLAEHEISMMAGLIAPGEASRVCGGLGRKGCFQANRFTSPQVWQNKMHFAGGARSKAWTGPLRRDRLASRMRNRDRSDRFVADPTAKHRYSNGNIV